MTKERRLGRGLEALLGRVAPKPGPAGQEAARQGGMDVPHPRPARPESDPEHGTQPAEDAPEQVLVPYPPPPETTPSRSEEPPNPPRIDMGLIDDNPFQPRQDFDPSETRALAESLQTHGLLQPVVVRPAGGGRYQLVAGQRRLRAAAMAGWSEVPIQVIQVDDRQVAELAIIENIQRKDLNPLEKAASFQRYLEQYGGTHEELASRLKIDRSTVSNLIRLLDLPAAVQEAVRQAKISQGHARALLPLGDEREQVRFCRRIQEEGLSVRRTESLVQQTIQQADAEPLSIIGQDGTRRSGRPRNEHIAALEQEFRSALGTKVKITHSSRGRGKLVIHFCSHQEFQRIRHHICYPDQPGVQPHAG